ARLQRGARHFFEVIIEPAARDEFLALMRESYSEAMSPAEFDWWFDRNPAGPRILNEARDDDGSALGVLAMSCARMSQGLAAFAVHAVTTPAARGRGVFSTLELANEEEAAAAGATWALGFTNPMAGPILVGGRVRGRRRCGASSPLCPRGRCGPRRRDRQPGRGAHLSRRGLSADAAHDPIHRKTPYGRCPRAAQETRCLAPVARRSRFL